MPMGKVKGKTKCQVCIDCEPMCNIRSHERSYRCYGEGGGAPLKKDFAQNKPKPPRIAPKWCPHRKGN